MSSYTLLLRTENRSICHGVVRLGIFNLQVLLGNFIMHALGPFAETVPNYDCINNY